MNQSKLEIYLMFIRAYLRASTKSQDASRAKKSLEKFAAEHHLVIAHFYLENESGASLKRPVLFDFIEQAKSGDILLIEQVDRLSRLNDEDWSLLKKLLNNKKIKVVSLDLWWSSKFGHDDRFICCHVPLIDGGRQVAQN